MTHRVCVGRASVGMCPEGMGTVRGGRGMGRRATPWPAARRIGTRGAGRGRWLLGRKGGRGAGGEPRASRGRALVGSRQIKRTAPPVGGPFGASCSSSLPFPPSQAVWVTGRRLLPMACPSLSRCALPWSWAAIAHPGFGRPSLFETPGIAAMMEGGGGGARCPPPGHRGHCLLPRQGGARLLPFPCRADGGPPPPPPPRSSWPLAPHVGGDEITGCLAEFRLVVPHPLPPHDTHTHLH